MTVPRIEQWLRRYLRCKGFLGAAFDEQWNEIADVFAVEAVVGSSDRSVDGIGGCRRKGRCEMSFHLTDLTFFFCRSHVLIVPRGRNLFYRSFDFGQEIFSTT